MTGRFIGPASVATGRRPARPPLPAIRDLDRVPTPPPHQLGRLNPQALGRHPPPPQRPLQRPAGAALAQPAGAGGGRQDTPVMASARRKTEVLTLGA